LDQNPAVSGARVVFERHATPGAQGDIVMFDTATSTETAIEGTASDARRPDIDGNIIVWDMVSGPGDIDVAIHNLANGTTQILARPGNQRSPHISGQVVTFDDDSSGNPDIMSIRIPSDSSCRQFPVTASFSMTSPGNRIFTRAIKQATAISGCMSSR
jgi:beta propeller repeat protein